ncbi:conserved hypothetical protein [Burkholderiales bacterium 8X]|nr:conserved hypothetical protein [Burkholderiales bacterium 8X]
MNCESAIKTLGMAVLLGLLLGCSAEQRALSLAKTRAEVQEGVDEYVNQLVRPGEPHAVLSTQPRPMDAVVRYSAYLLLKFDGKRVARPVGVTWNTARPLPRQLAFSELKVPVGPHDLYVSGGGVRSYFTEFSKVNFEAGKRYVISEEVAPDETLTVHISEYEPDRRFLPSEQDYYVIGKRISDAVELGSSYVVDMKAARP